MAIKLSISCTVLPEWTDYNGHFNVAYYALAFDRAAAGFWTSQGACQEMSAQTVVKRAAITYTQEAHLGSVLSFEWRVMRILTTSDGTDSVSRIAMFADKSDMPISVQERRERLPAGVDAAALIAECRDSEDPFAPRGWEGLVTV